MADPMRGDKKPPAANFATTTTSSSASSTVAATNFEYDNENEWDVGIGDLIIDLDADIEKTTSTTLPPTLSSSVKQQPSSIVQAPAVGSPLKASQAGGAASLLHPNTMAVEHSATVDKGLKMKIKRTQKPSGNKQHEIVKSGGAGSASGPSGAVFNSNAASKDRTGSVENGSDSGSTPGSNPGPGTPQNKKQAASILPSSAASSHRKGDKKSSAPPSSTPTPYHPPPHCDELLVAGANTPGPPLNVTPGSLPSSSSSSTTGILLNNNSTSSSTSTTSAVTSSGSLSLSELHDVRHKQIKTEQKETADVCIGTSVGTITEPECLGPCEPGTSVTLEGIVWHETEGVLVVNVTWRGKTYVGTLLDCTRHDWAPPRFCDSPTSDLDARTTKNSAGASGSGGRSSKRGRSSAGANALGSGSQSGSSGGGNGGLGSGGFGSGDSGFTETRSSKLRNNSGSSSGKDGRDGNTSNGNSSNGAGKDAKSQRRTTNNSNSSGITTGNSGTSSPTPFLPPRPDKRKASKDEGSSSSGSGPNSGSDSKKSRNSSPPPTPVLLECPDPNCSKKYKHINGLRYHQNHAHGGIGSVEEDSNATSSTTPVGETETENTDVETPDIAGDNGDSTLRLPVDNSGPSLSSGAGSHPLPNQASTGPPTPGPAPPNGQGPPGFKIRSPASLLTDVHSLDTSSNNTNNSHQMDLSSNAASSHNKKKRKLDDDGEDIKSPSTGATGSQPLDSSAVQNVGPGAGPLGPTEPSSPAYSDISDDETRGPAAGRYPPGEPLQGGPTGPYPAYPVPSAPGQPGLPPGSIPGATLSTSQDKLDLHKDLLKPANSWSPGDAQSVGAQPPAGLSHPISYYPYSLSGGYPYGQVPPVPPNSSSLPPVGPPGGPPPSQPLQGPLPSLSHEKSGNDSVLGDKSGNENHQILKESHEVKTQVLLPGTYQRPGPQDGSGNRFYLYNSPASQDNIPGGPGGRPRSNKDPSSHPSPNSGKSSSALLKDIKKERDGEDSKQEGVKPTMETQGPPPAPTSQPYAYIHAGYHLAPGPPYQYGAPEPTGHPPGPPHPMYRGGPLGVLPPHLLSMHLHPHARYPPAHGPEDLSTPSSEQKGLDMYYQAASQQHKIHELQERALKSPNNAGPGKQHGPNSGPGAPSNRGPSPSTGPGERGPPNSASGPGSTGPSSGGGPPGTPLGKEGSGGRRSSSPPPQRHVHTHHHTHVGLGYSILAGQYPAPYGAAAVQAVINQYPPTTK